MSYLFRDMNIVAEPPQRPSGILANSKYSAGQYSKKSLTMYKTTDNKTPAIGIIMGSFLPFLSLHGPKKRTNMMLGKFSRREA